MVVIGMNRYDLASSIVPITGGASGIGFAIARLVRAEGGRPILLDINGALMQLALEELYPGEHPERYGHVVDVSDSEAVNSAFDAIKHEHGPITHAVANAATVWRGKIMDMPEDAWRKVMDVNINGVLHTCRAAARQMAAAGGGSIVTTSSIGGLRVRLDRTAYATSKAAIIQLTRALALELGPMDIRVNCIAPGLVDTQLQSDSATFMGSPAAVQNAAARGAIARLGTADEIANPALFLLSDLSSYITGETLVVDGGVSIRYA
jgi:NAD(P)-dependent dehydrogenase (short-subunit alcohol dehydrogenase family)